MDKVQQRTYELTYLLPGSMTDNDVAQVRTEVEALLKKYKANVLKNEDWGRKPLSYIITHEGKKQSDALYVHVVFEVASNQAQQLERDVYLNNKIMRHLLLVAEEPVDLAAEKVAE
jgi:ribosomal protein S6